MRSVRRVLGFVFPVLAFVLTSPALCEAQGRPRLVNSIDVQIPVAPIPVRIAGKAHLAYELHITNFRTLDVALTRVEVLDGYRNDRLESFQDSELARWLGRPGIGATLANKRVIGAGMRAVVYFWLPLDGAKPTPTSVRHRIELDMAGSAGVTHEIIESAPLAVGNDGPVVLSPPLRGGPWAAVYDPSMERGHRTFIYTINGRARIPARFAIDWIKIADDATRAKGDKSKIANWYGYGADVLAVADGTVAQAEDDMSEATETDAASGPLSLEYASGNHVVLDLGQGRYAFYEHLKSGSIKVRAGERVRAGDVIAALGNSGSSSAGPHLHFHVADANATLAAEGLPYVFTSFRVVGAFESIDHFGSGKRWNPAPADAGGARKLELPAANVVLTFD
ncbi:MAG: M23 family metallopeptidase [Steroidobacteraceae bacterium]